MEIFQLSKWLVALVLRRCECQKHFKTKWDLCKTNIWMSESNSIKYTRMSFVVQKYECNAHLFVYSFAASISCEWNVISSFCTLVFIRLVIRRHLHIHSAHICFISVALTVYVCICTPTCVLHFHFHKSFEIIMLPVINTY